MKILLINCQQQRRPCNNETLLHQAVVARGHQLEVLPWDEVTPASNCDVAVVRLVWDYVQRFEDFDQWLKTMAKAKFPIFNSLKTIAWNMQKDYLLELQQKSIRVPRSYLWRGQFLPNFVEFEKALGEPPYVFKPVVSSGGRGTFLVQGDVSYSAAIDRMQRKPFIAQEYLREVKTGEVSVILFNGEYSHAVRKIPQSGDFRVHAEYGGSVDAYVPERAEIEWAISVWKHAPDQPLIARVDYIKTPNGPMLIELEVIEPELFFDKSSDAADKLIQAIESRAG